MSRMKTFNRDYYDPWVVPKQSCCIFFVPMLIFVSMVANILSMYFVVYLVSNLQPYINDIGSLIGSKDAANMLFNTEAIINETCILLHAQCV